MERGGVDIGEAAHSVDSDGKVPPLLALGSQEVTLSLDVADSIEAGLGDDGCTWVIIDNGASMLKIWFSACGGP